jgi:hypothetical protein
MEKYGFVYLWFDRKHKRYYIGSHWGTEDDGYVCSSPWMIKAYKIRPEDFKRRIIIKIYKSRKDLLEEEYRWLSMISDEEIINKKYYNRTKHKIGHWSAENYERDIKKRISIKTKEAMQRPEVRENYLAAMKNRNNIPSAETLEKRSAAMKKTMAEKYPNRKVRMKLGSDEYKKTLSDKTKELWNKPGHRESVGQKISESNRGKKFRAGIKNSKEHNKRICESNAQKALDRFKQHLPILIETRSLSVTAVAKIIGISRTTVSKYRKQMSTNLNI